jgi:ABC-type branched-subunit amino acid transport system substrate-binding protein
MDWPTGMSGNQEAAQLVDWAVEGPYSPAYIIVGEPKTSYVTSLTRYLRAALKLNDIPITGVGTARLDGSNVMQIVKDIHRLHPHVILTAVFSPYVEKIVAGLRRHGITAPILVTDGMDAQLELGKYSLADKVEVFFASFGFARLDSKSFFDAYKARFRKRPNPESFAGLGLETVRVLEAAVTKGGSTQPRAIDAALAGGMKVPGVGLADKTYAGNGVREPATDVGIARVDAPPGVYYAWYSSIPTNVPRP